MSDKPTYEEMEQRIKELEKEILESELEEDLIRIQRDLSIELNSLENLNDGLSLCLEAAIKASGMDCGGIYLFDKTSKSLDMLYHYGLPSDFLKESSHYESDSDNVRLVAAGQPKYTRHKYLDISLGEAEHRENLKAIAVLPISHKKQVIGCLNIASHSLEEVPFASRNALESITEQIGGAVLRLQTEEALQESEQRYQSLIENLSIGIFRNTPGPEGKFIMANPALAKMYGYDSVKELLQVRVSEVYWVPAERQNIADKISIQGYIRDEEIRLKKRDGTFFWGVTNINTVRDKYGEIVYFEGLIEDITKRKLIEENLKKSEQQFRMIYENAPVLIDAFNDDGRCILWNRECRKTFGWTMEEINSFDNPLSLLFPDPEILEQVIVTVTSKPEGDFKEWYPITKDGTKLIVMWANFRILDGTVINIGYDITATKRMQDRIILSERLGATGQLAASIAHEINSPLQAVTTMLGVLMNEYKEDEYLAENLDLLKGAFRSIRDTVKNLLDLNRPGKEEKQQTNVNKVLKQTFDLNKVNFKRNKIKINMDLSLEIPYIITSPQQLNHVFLNLINNAVEAMTERSDLNKEGGKRKSGGEINISTMVEEENIVIKLSDNGPGIQEKDMNRIFDQFYTRKKRMGMGVGLSICHGFIEEHGGIIAAKNLSEGGVMFMITLPCQKLRNCEFRNSLIKAFGTKSTYYYSGN